MRLFFLAALLIPLPVFAQDTLPQLGDINEISIEESLVAPLPKKSVAPSEFFSTVLKPRQEAILSAEVDARVEKIAKEFGQPFRKGEKLIQLDSTLYRLRVKKAEAEEAKEQITFTAISDLYKNRSSSIIDLEEARLNLSNAKTELVFARYRLDRCAISAPYNGRVERLAVNENEWVNAGDPLIKIVGDGTLLARTLIPASSLPLFTLDKEVEIALADGKKVAGRVSHLGAVMDSASQTFEIDIEVPNTDGSLISGMTGKIIPPEGAYE